jgi:hypothetical protein
LSLSTKYIHQRSKKDWERRTNSLSFLTILCRCRSRSLWDIDSCIYRSTKSYSRQHNMKKKTAKTHPSTTGGPWHNITGKLSN